MKNSDRLFPPEIMERSYQKIYIKRYRRTHIIYLFVILTIISTAVTLPFLHVDVTSQSRGVLRSSVDPSTISSPRSGFLIYSNLYDGVQVFVGDTLFVLSAEKLIEQEKQLILQSLQLRAEIKDLSQMIQSCGKNSRVSQPKYASQVEVFNRREQELILELKYLQDEDSIKNLLYKGGVIAARTYEECHMKLRRAQEGLNLHRERQIVHWQDQKHLLTLQARELNHRQLLLAEEKKNYVSYAPSSGIVSGLKGITEGTFVSQGQALGQIVPNGDLVVELAIHPKDIGLIHIGQKVLFQMDAFNYREWGMANGEVSSIYDLARISENSYSFRVRCKIDEDYLKLKSGFIGRLQQGMTLTAHIVLTRRSLLQLLFDQADDWLNPMLNTN